MNERDEARFWAKVDKSGDCWLWTASTIRGYGCFGLRGSPTPLAHRLSYIMAYGPVPDGLYVCHSCDTKACVNPAHLYAATPRQNAQDASARGLLPTGDDHHTRRTPERNARGDRNGMRTHPESRPFGERQGRSKLTATEVLEIRVLAAEGQSWGKLGRRFGVDKSNIGCIVHRKSWRHI